MPQRRIADRLVRHVCAAVPAIATLDVLTAPASAEVFGADDRRDVRPREAAMARGVGLLVDTRTRSACITFCVSPAVVATAAHCVWSSSHAAGLRVADIAVSFAPHDAASSTTIAGVGGKPQPQFVSLPWRAVNAVSEPSMSDDWAILRLARPLCHGRVLGIAAATTVDPLKGQHTVASVAYHADRGFAAPAIVDGCRAWPAAGPDRLVLHDCDTGGAASGSPLFAVGAPAFEVIAMTIGVYVETRVVVRESGIETRSNARSLANAAIDVRSLAARVGTLEHADILASPDDIARLQRALASGGWFRSSINGVFSPALGAAIETAEVLTGRAATGLPTRALLMALTQHRPNPAGPQAGP
jgi:protease YdgD